MASGRQLAEAFVRVYADYAEVGPTLERETQRAVDRAGRRATRDMTELFGSAGQLGGKALTREAEAGGARAGTAARRSMASKLQGAAVDGQRAGRDAGGRFAKATGDEVDRQGRGLVGKVGGIAGKMGAALGAVAVGGAVVGFFRDAVTGASDLAEAGNKLGVLFGPAAPRIQTWAQGAATSIGLSTLAAQDAAATFGVMAKSANLTGDAAADFSTEFVKLAGDLASFYNTSPEQAVEAIGAAFRGEAEPIRAYGVLLDDATLRQAALALGLIKTTKEALTPQQRVLAAQAEILRQTGSAQGDFARTSEGLANQQRILAAQFENAKSQLGQSLLPVLVDVVSTLNTSVLPAVGSFIDFMQGLPGPVVKAGLVIAGLLATAAVGGAVFNRLSGFVTSLGDNLSQLSGKPAGAVTGLRGGIGAIAGAMAGPWGLAFTAGTTILGVWAAKQVEAKQRVDELTDSIKADSGALGENTRQKLVNRLESEGLLADAQRLGVTLSDVTDAVLGNGAALGRVQSILGQYRADTGGVSAALGDGAAAHDANANAANRLGGVLGSLSGDLAAARESYDRQTAAAGANAGAAGKVAEGAAGAAAAQGTMKTATQQLEAAQKGLTDAFDHANARFLDARAANRALAEAVDGTREALKENGRTLNINTEAGRSNQVALDAVAAR